jgi:hypothetical protein
MKLDFQFKKKNILREECGRGREDTTKDEKFRSNCIFDIQ